MDASAKVLIADDELIAAIKRSLRQNATVEICACEDRASIDAALLAGASAYMVKTVRPIEPPPSGLQLRAPLSRTEQTFSGPQLTARETGILKAIARGLTTRAISRDLWLSEHTVKFHITNIYRKLGVPNRSAAVRYAFENDLAP
jgi:DNA-binding NarL/FixJ family response regulator